MNRTSLSFRATWRTRPSSLHTLTPALRPGRVSLTALPLAGPLSSTTSAATTVALFGGFAGTTGPSDFPRPCIEGLRPKPFPHDPPARTSSRGTSRFSRMEIPYVPGSQTARGPTATRDSAAADVAFRPM